MAAINTVTFNAGSTGTDGAYNTGDSIVVTIDYTPDTPNIVAEAQTLTATVTNSAGTVTASTSAPFSINVPNPAGDVLAVSDSGAVASHTWTPGASSIETDGSIEQSFSTTA